MRKTTQKEDKRQGMDKNENRQMIEAVAALAKEKNISKELLFSAIEEALKSAYKNNFSKEYGMPPSNANVRVELNRETGAVRPQDGRALAHRRGDRDFHRGSAGDSAQLPAG